LREQYFLPTGLRHHLRPVFFNQRNTDRPSPIPLFGTISLMRLRKIFIFLILSALFASCTRAANAPAWTPFAPPDTPGAESTAAIVLTYLPSTRAPGTPISTPTPDSPITIPTITPSTFTSGATPTAGPFQYIIQQGDYLGSIAAQFNITIEELMTANGMTSVDEIIYPGQALIIPGAGEAPTPEPIYSGVTSTFKIIPDSELINSPLAVLTDVESFVANKGGYLAYYSQEISGTGETLTGAQVVERVAEDYSVNPRLLLAILEYQSQWVTNANPAPSTIAAPISNIIDDPRSNRLYRQLAWTADKLNEGYYLWKIDAIKQFTLNDGSIIRAEPAINAGTAGIQNLFSYFDDTQTWQIDVGPNGVFLTYSNLFGYPFDFAVEHLVPDNLQQPSTWTLPFAAGETWSFTGGPHGGWDSGSAFGALDFAPPGDPIGCAIANYWTLAIADGLIIRSRNGQVIQDLDGDGLTQTGWNILYLHIDQQDRVPVGTYLHAGDKIGRASCEGGFSPATHLHIARKYNGQWIHAEHPAAPFTLDGWVASGDGIEYNGWLVKNGVVIEAWDGVNPINQITR
jgi:LysM repeat protein